MQVYATVLHINSNVILGIMNPDHKHLPFIVVNNDIVSASAWAENHREWTGLRSPQLQTLMWLNAVKFTVRRKCWIMTDLWKHAWGEDHWLHVIHDDGEICGKNNERFLNGRKANVVQQDRWMVATGYMDYIERIDSAMAKGDSTWVLTENLVLKPAASYSFA